MLLKSENAWKVTTKNVRDPFSRHKCILSLNVFVINLQNYAVIPSLHPLRSCHIHIDFLL